MKPSSAKNKGRRLQQFIVKRLINVLKVSYADIRSVPGSVTGEDLWLSDYARSLFPFSIEAKNRESLNIWSSLEQAESNAGNNVPLVVFKRNNSETYVVLRFETFMNLWKFVLHFIPDTLRNAEALKQ